MKITIYNQQSDLKFPDGFVETIVYSTLEECPCEEVIIHLVDKNKISELHEIYFQDPTPTDCISFPIDKETVLGEVFVCPEVAIEYAQKNEKDPLEETALYIVHGLLHLLGYDDLTPSDRAKMRSAEKTMLKKVVVRNLI